MIKLQYQAIILICICLIVSQFFFGLYLDKYIFSTNGIFAIFWGWIAGFIIAFFVLRKWASYTMKSHQINGLELSEILDLNKKSIIFKFFSKI